MRADDHSPSEFFGYLDTMSSAVTQTRMNIGDKPVDMKVI